MKTKVVDEKKCKKCRSSKPIAEYWRDKTTHDGLRGVCKTCTSAYRIEYRARGNRARTPIERFEDIISPEPNTGCWLWSSITGSTGYGLFHDGLKLVGAHRWAYEFFKAQIFPGFEIDHRCGVRCCVNPDHLEVVSHRENLIRAKAKITHCPKGHPYDQENTRYRTGKGHRICKACHRACVRARKARHQEQEKQIP